MLVAVCMMAVFAVDASARGPGGKGERGDGDSGLGVPRGKWWNRTEIVQTVGITDEQVKKIENMYTAYRKDAVNLRAKMELVEIDLEQAMDAKEFNYDNAKKLVFKYNDYRSDLKKEKMVMLLNIRKMLTSEQFDKLKASRGDKKGKKGDGHGHGDGMGRSGNGGEKGKMSPPPDHEE